MRKYNLTLISNDNPTINYSYYGGPNTLMSTAMGINGVSGLNIDFTLPFYTNQGGANIPAVITLINPDLKFFFKSLQANKGNLGKALNGYRITLEAGWGYSALLAKSQAVPSYDLIDNNMSYGTIYEGVVSAFLPNYADLKSPSITIACMPSASTTTKITQVLSIEGAINQNEVSLFSNNFTNSGIKVDFDNSVKLFNSGKQCIIIRAKGLREALEKLANIGIYNSRTPLGNIRLYYKKPQKAPFLTKQSALTSINQEAPKSSSALNVSTPPKEILATQIIGIPQVQDAITISIVIALNYRYRLGDLVYLDEKKIYRFALQNNDYASIVSAVEIGGVTAGLFKVVGVEHVGNFRSKEAAKWATKLLLTREI